MKILNEKQNHYLCQAILMVMVLFCASLFTFLPEKSFADVTPCDGVWQQYVTIDIPGFGSFDSRVSDNGNITISPNTSLTFTVVTRAEPSSENHITYPGSGGIITYSGPSSAGRSYTTSPINSTESIFVDLYQFCDGTPPEPAELTVTINMPAPSCAIDSFSCSGATLAWNTTNCTSRSISPTIGPVGATGSATGSGGTTYTLTASNSANSVSSVAYCPRPAVNSAWNENSLDIITETLTTGQTTLSVPLNFWNSGESGSVLVMTDCAISSASGVSYGSISLSCPLTTLTAP